MITLVHSSLVTRQEGKKNGVTRLFCFLVFLIEYNPVYYRCTAIFNIVVLALSCKDFFSSEIEYNLVSYT